MAVANGAAIVLNKLVAPEIKKSILDEKLQPATIVESKSGISVVKMALPLVLIKLENEFQATIRFNRRELTDISVTATFSSKETISSILEQIALLNNLNLSKDGSTAAPNTEGKGCPAVIIPVVCRSKLFRCIKQQQAVAW